MNKIEQPNYIHYSRVKEINLDEAERLLASFELRNKGISDHDEYERLLEIELDSACKVILGALEDHDFEYHDLMPYERDENGYKIDYFSCIKVKTRDFCIWASKLKYDLPEELVDLISQNAPDDAQEVQNDNTTVIPCGSDAKTNKGKTKGALTEAVVHAFEKLLSQGNTEVLKAGSLRSFLRCLKDMATEENKNADEYILERIANVKIPKGGICIVTTKERQIRVARHIKLVPARDYKDNAISKLLTKLREEQPLHP